MYANVCVLRDVILEGVLGVCVCGKRALESLWRDKEYQDCKKKRKRKRKPLVSCILSLQKEQNMCKSNKQPRPSSLLLTCIMLCVFVCFPYIEITARNKIV